MTDTIFITGAGSGIGRALALSHAAEAAVLHLADINETGLAETASLATAAGAGAVTITPLDVADRTAVEAAAQEVLAASGAPDVVYNNAGVALSDPVATMSYEDMEWLFGINFWGVVHGTKAFLPAMLERGRGAIVNVSSLFGLVGVPSQSAYCAAKHAVRGFTETLRLEVAGSGVTAHTVHPGGVSTNIARKARFRRGVGGSTNAIRALNAIEKSLVLPPEEAARQIRRGVAKGDPRIIVGKDARRPDRLSRLMPRKTGDMILKGALQK